MRPSVTDTTLLFPFLRRQSDAPPTQEDTVLSAESGESITDRAVVPIDIREIAQDIKLWNSFKFVRPTQAEVDKYFKSFLQIQHPNGTDIICKTSVLEVYVADSLSTIRHRRGPGHTTTSALQVIDSCIPSSTMTQVGQCLTTSPFRLFDAVMGLSTLSNIILGLLSK